MGIVIGREGWPPIMARTYLPYDVIRQFLRRYQHIGQPEALASLLGPEHFPKYFEECDVMHYLDNTSSLVGAVEVEAEPHTPM